MTREKATTRSKAVRSTSVGGRAYHLVVVDGPDRGMTFTIDESQPSRSLVGQSDLCALKLSDRTVSRRHAAITPDAEGVHVVDLDSTNGTRVSGVRVSDAWAPVGATLAFGETTLAVEATSPASLHELSARTSFGRVLGASVAVRRLYPLLERLAASALPLLVEGETGTGKELVAEALHEEGSRCDGPFLVFDAGSFEGMDAQSELLGAGATPGLLQRARGGTLVIDEISALDVRLQSKLLPILDKLAVDSGDVARVIVTSRADPDKEVEAGRLEEALLHRVGAARVELPPLRERTGDVSLLARHFWSEAGGDPTELTEDFMYRLEDRSWPGNVRELRHAIARYRDLGVLDTASTSSATSTPTDGFEAAITPDLSFAQARQRIIAEFERRYVQCILEAHGGNVSRAAASSGIARRYFQVLRARHRDDETG